MAFPTKLREKLGVSFIITIGLDHSLYAFSSESWEEFTQDLRSLTGEKSRAAKLFVINACEVEPDKQGRVLIPQNLREYAYLDHDVTILGVRNHAEVWDSKRFKEYHSEIINSDLLDEAVAGISIW